MRVEEKVVRQEAKQEAAGEEEEPGEDLGNLSAYNMRPSWARSPNFTMTILVPHRPKGTNFS